MTKDTEILKVREKYNQLISAQGTRLVFQWIPGHGYIAGNVKADILAKKPAKVITPKRSQAVGILLSSLRLEFSDIEDAIYNLDTSILDVEKFKAIFDNRSDVEEMKSILKQLEKHPEVPLDKPEQFLYDLEQIPQVGDRIFCFLFHTNFQENITMIDSKLNNLKMTCEMLSSYKSVKRIFGLILACGNYMNGGSRTRGQADGFDLEVLPKIRDVKGKDNRTSLLQYVVSSYVQRYDTDLMGTDRAKLPLPDPSDIQQAGLVNFDDLEKELKKIHSDFDSAEMKANRIISRSRPETLEPFRRVMTSFFDKGKQDLTEQQSNLKECSRLFDKTCAFFCVKPKSGDKKITPEIFFSLWLSFCTDFKDIWKKEQQALVKLKLKEAEERVRKIKESKAVLPQTKARKAGGLKDRLSRHGKM
ncbi:formin-2 [Elysia marginata]|uniref:Formin-2 n=1 Tax=Elysia marginata TaxID=1093978 RepID=A0AAV4EVW9_9GAST|nr:formin-2 [Elysia marginata]